MRNKISLEDHFMLPSYAADGPVSFTKSVRKDFADEMVWRLPDFEKRVAEMDNAGIELSVLSLTQPGIQAELSADAAISAARLMNDQLAQHATHRFPTRLKGFAALPLQDPKAAGTELERAVRELGFVGACINGYTSTGDGSTGTYLDDESTYPFWEVANDLAVPIYLHPRVPLKSQQRIYEGYPALLGSAWGFGHETATHALRLILSGLFDRFKNVQVILGHMGEGLPFSVARLDHRLQFQPPATRGRQQKPVAEYLRTNIMMTTSGACRTQALLNAMLEVGADRIMFSTDYPFESMQASADWFDTTPIADSDKEKIGRSNALRVLRGLS